MEIGIQLLLIICDYFFASLSFLFERGNKQNLLSKLNLHSHITHTWFQHKCHALCNVHFSTDKQKTSIQFKENISTCFLFSSQSHHPLFCNISKMRSVNKVHTGILTYKETNKQKLEAAFKCIISKHASQKDNLFRNFPHRNHVHHHPLVWFKSTHTYTVTSVMDYNEFSSKKLFCVIKCTSS